MSNPFKAGDKLVALPSLHACYAAGQVVTVSRATPDRVVCEEAYLDGGWPMNGNHTRHFRAAIAGVDYMPNTKPTDATYEGHLADGSSVQKHSAGPLYPCVLVWRDKKGGPNELTMKARGVARCLTYNDDTPQAEAKHMLLEMAHRLDALDVRAHKVAL